jgi:L-threonylcarbamoyladenylate synthase
MNGEPAPGEALTTILAPANPQSIARAGAILRAGGLVAMPTETVYGLAADATSDRAIAAIYAAKQRPAFNPLIAHFSDIAAARREAIFSDDALALAAAFWPGPLTLVVPTAPTCRIGLLARAGLESVALRVPDHRIARALIEAAGVPLAAPSANRSGRVSPTLASHVLADLDGRIDMILDDGPCRIGLESTIVACLDGAPRLLRRGAITGEALAAALGHEIPDDSHGAESAPLAPGQLVSHYAPRARLRLDAAGARPDEAALDFGGVLAASSSHRRLDLSPRGDLTEAAANLFAFLRDLDATGTEAIAVAPIPAKGLGAAIVDRLRRAAAPRDK